ncbi:MAG: hypothetical protein NTY37_09430 [Methanothrix sp.]|nr:hypothetical protein [Methanothrix sp.]
MDSLTARRPQARGREPVAMLQRSPGFDEGRHCQDEKPAINSFAISGN